MNRRDDFEERLQRQPWRPLPPAWREEILGAAQAAAKSALPASSAQADWRSLLRARLNALLWPHPKAWAGLVAVWIVVMGLNLSSREAAAPGIAPQAALPSRQMRELLRQQDQMLAELVGPVEKPLADRPRQAAPRPRSAREETFSKA